MTTDQRDGTAPDDFTPLQVHMIGQIMKAERSLPDEFWCVAAVQELACLLVKLEPLLSDADMATLIGVGAFIARQGRVEMKAEIEAINAIARAMREPPHD